MWRNGNSQPLWKSVAVSYSVKRTLNIHNPEIPLVGIYPRKMKTFIHVNTCMWIFIILKNWKQSKGPPTEKWINKSWYIHTM